jgi:hypothetical protein
MFSVQAGSDGLEFGTLSLEFPHTVTIALQLRRLKAP